MGGAKAVVMSMLDLHLTSENKNIYPLPHPLSASPPTSAEAPKLSAARVKQDFFFSPLCVWFKALRDRCLFISVSSHVLGIWKRN